MEKSTIEPLVVETVDVFQSHFQCKLGLFQMKNKNTIMFQHFAALNWRHKKLCKAMGTQKLPFQHKNCHFITEH